MKAKELAEILLADPEAEVQIQVKATKDENGYRHTVSEWVPIEKKHITKTPFGGNQLFIG